jgi:hypothetical protein
VLGLEPGQPPRVAQPARVACRLLGQIEAPFGMPALHLVRSLVFLELFVRVLAHGFEKPVARLAVPRWFGHHERLFHQFTQEIQDLVSRNAPFRHHRLRGLQEPPAREHREPGEQDLLRPLQ